MPTNEHILKKAQAAIESTRGTDLAATRKVYAKFAYAYDRGLQDFQDTTGTFQARRRAAYGRPNVSWTATDIATFEDLPWWGQMAWKGAVTGTTDGGTPAAYTYTFLPTITSDDLKSFTLEHGEPSLVYQSNQVMVDTWTLRGDADSDNEPGWMFETNMMAINLGTTTFTGAISDRTTEVITARGTKIYVDSATIGTTQVTGKLISWSITGNNALHNKAFAEDESSYPANKVGRQAQTVDAQFVMEFSDDTEFANFRATTPVLRKIRLEREGTLIHGTPNTYKRLRIDLYGYWSSFAEGDRDGNIIATFGLAGFYDSTAGGMFQAAIVNDLVSLP